MRARGAFGLIGALLVATPGVVVPGVVLPGIVAPAGAATAVQTCTGPSPSTQSGRLTLSPGLNALPTKQKITVKVSLFSCSPSKTTGGSGTLKSTFWTPTAQTCALFASPHALQAMMTVTWRNLATSTMALTVSLTGPTRLANVTGTVKWGLFAGRSVAGQFRYKPVVSPDGNSMPEACANKAVPALGGRISVVALDLFTTQHFTIT